MLKNNNLTLTPTGNILTCKSQIIQEVDMDKTYNSGVISWSFYLPKKMLSFCVGLKDNKNKKSVQFDFSLKHSTFLTFKLDLEKNSFKCWIN